MFALQPEQTRSPQGSLSVCLSSSYLIEECDAGPRDLMAKCGADRLVGESDDLFRRVFHSGGGNESQSGLFDHLTALFDICAFETNHDWDFNTNVPSSSYNAGCNHIGTHDPSEDVDQNRSYVLV